MRRLGRDGRAANGKYRRYAKHHCAGLGNRGELADVQEGGVMREWLVIDSSWKHSIFAPDNMRPVGYIPRDTAEKLLGRNLSGTVWFTKKDSEQMRNHPEWTDTEPSWSPLGFWSSRQ